MSALAKAGVSVSFSRTHRPTATRTMLVMKGRRQPHSLNCSGVRKKVRHRNRLLAAR